mgnify:CR=1 FL=1
MDYVRGQYDRNQANLCAGKETYKLCIDRRDLIHANEGRPSWYDTAAAAADGCPGAFGRPSDDGKEARLNTDGHP